MLTRYPNEELTWDTMAKRMLAGLSYTPDHHSDATSPTDGSEAMEVSEENVKKETDGNSANKNSLKERIRLVVLYEINNFPVLPYFPPPFILKSGRDVI